MENISLGGLFVRCSTPLKVGTAVKLELQLPGAAHALTIDGKVTSSVTQASANERHRSPGMGIAFEPLPPRVVPLLDGLIATIDPSGLEMEATLEPRPVVKAPPSPEQLLREVALLKVEVLKRNRKITELLAENEKLRAKS